MTWLSWRQHRALFAATGIVVGGLCLALLMLGQNVHNVFHGSGLEACLKTSAGCGDLRFAFDDRFRGLQILMPLVLACPLLIGLFWGAPLVAREVEQGTHRLVWTQSTTRRRWLLAKLAFVGAIALVMATAFALTSSWFAEPFNAVNGSRMSAGLFDLQGVVPIAYTLFAFALGVAAGAVFGRTVPAMGVTLLGFVFSRGLVGSLARSRFLPTKVVTFSTFGREARTNFGAWVVDGRIVTRTGEVFSSDGNLNFTPASLHHWCPSLTVNPGDFLGKGDLQPCLDGLGLRTIQTFHPAGQYWALQAIEAGLFLVAAAGLVAFTVWWVLRRVT
jgi:hypothetical protein